MSGEPVFTLRQGFDLLAKPASKSDQPSKVFIWCWTGELHPVWPGKILIAILLLWKVMLNHVFLFFPFSRLTPYLWTVVVPKHRGLEVTSSIFTSVCYGWGNLAPNKRPSSARWWIQIRREALCREGASISLLGYGGSSFPFSLPWQRYMPLKTTHTWSYCTWIISHLQIPLLADLMQCLCICGEENVMLTHGWEI